MKCIIIDDDPLITDLVLHYADKCELISSCLACNNAVDGLKLLSNGAFDLLFLDYNMPDLNGKAILELKQDGSAVVMITSDKEFAVETYQFDDVKDYLLKPLNYDDFESALIRLSANDKVSINKEQSNPTGKNKIIIKDGNNWIPVDIDSIRYIKSESNYCHLITESGNIMTLSNLSNLIEKLPDYFIRSHRSYVINTHFIERLNLENIYIGSKMIPISAKYKSDIKAYIQKNS